MWFDPQSNLLVYPTHDHRLLEHCEGATTLTSQGQPPMMAFPATLKNLQIARHFGYDVVRPLQGYTWPRSTRIRDPFKAQTETSNFLTLNPRAYVFNDMGTGKTLAALWAADYLMTQDKFSALVVAPLSTLHTVWEDTAFQHFLSRRKVVVLHGSEEKRKQLLAQPADFYVCNHDGVKVGAHLDKLGKVSQLKIHPGGFAAALRDRQDIRMAIVDEAGAFRDHRSLRSKVARKIVANRDYFWGLTGTPMPQSPVDAYGLARLLNDAHGETWTNFRNRVMLQVSKYTWKPRAGGYEAALGMLSPYIRFSIDDCQDLPELTVQNRQVDLSAEQRAAIKKLKSQLMLLTESGAEISAVNEAAMRSKLLQICQGCVYDDNHGITELDWTPRLEVLKEIIEESGAKVLIFAAFTSVINRLNVVLKDYSREVILGSTPPRDRQRIIQAFQKDRDPHVLLAHPETISHGQTLTAAAVTVWFGPIDKSDVYVQANKRMHRPGQTRACTVVNLCGSNIEREVFQRLATNEKMQGVVLQLARGEI